MPQQSAGTQAPLRFVAAASLFDGHDAAINLMRRLIQANGAEVIHLGHNRSVEDVVRAALQEDADAIALSSYQGGHLEYFQYMVDMLRERGAGHIRVFGSGGESISRDEIAALEAYGVERIYHAGDVRTMTVEEMIADVITRTARARAESRSQRMQAGTATDTQVMAPDSSEFAIAKALTRLEDQALVRLESGQEAPSRFLDLRRQRTGSGRIAPVIGITGTGGAGKSSVIDELLIRFLAHFPGMRIAVISVDPTRQRSGGALLGDRIRMNALRSPRVYMRSMATRRQSMSTNAVLSECVQCLKGQGFDLVIVETAGIGQSDSDIVSLVDFPVYVMTSDYGAASQLEKIDMLDYARLIVLNKYDQRGAADALRDIRKQWRRNRNAFTVPDEAIPVYPTIASQFNDPGMDWMFINLCRLLREGFAASENAREAVSQVHDATHCDFNPQLEITQKTPNATVLIPGQRIRYLAEIAEQGRGIEGRIRSQSELARRVQRCWQALEELKDPVLPAVLEQYSSDALTDTGVDASLRALRQHYNNAITALDEESLQLLKQWPMRLESITGEINEHHVRGMIFRIENYRISPSGQKIPKIAAPQYHDWGDLLRFLVKENLPGSYPYTGGIHPYRRRGDEPIRMFAGEGAPERTNRRFHFLSQGHAVVLLSVTFDSVTLYGEDPAQRPDIYGKIGNSGVSVPTLDDMKKLYSGFDLCSPAVSVSMTIDGPAPMILAMFMNTAIDQQVEKYLKQDPYRWAEAKKQIDVFFQGKPRPDYEDELPPGHDGLGLSLLGMTGDQLVDADTYARIKAETLASVRGTVQTDILKEDQAQNTSIFSTEFALRMMGDIQQYFVENNVKQFHSVSISGYHIAQAGANPVNQLAFTLANGFTIAEYYLSRGMQIDDFAPNLSFFFSNGMDPEYTVIGRVARRIWARAMRERYGGNQRSQMIKYHIQTSSRSLRSAEDQFNDIRTTLQALYALFDNCNSLNTSAFDEAITTPTADSMRRATAIQTIINKEFGLNYCENPWQGSFIIEHLTDLMEEAVYQEFEAISERGGVLGAMDTMYQRGKIKEETVYFEHKKTPSIPSDIIHVPGDDVAESVSATGPDLPVSEEKSRQIANVRLWQKLRNGLSGDVEQQEEIDVDTTENDEYSPHAHGLKYLQLVARERGNVFSALMEAVKTHSLGQISHALYAVGGEYRRNM